MLMDVILESLLYMDDETLDYVLESCTDEEIELIDSAMENVADVKKAVLNGARAVGNVVAGPDAVNKAISNSDPRYKKDMKWIKRLDKRGNAGYDIGVFDAHTEPVIHVTHDAAIDNYKYASTRERDERVAPIIEKNNNSKSAEIGRALRKEIKFGNAAKNKSSNKAIESLMYAAEAQIADRNNPHVQAYRSAMKQLRQYPHTTSTYVVDNDSANNGRNKREIKLDGEYVTSYKGKKSTKSKVYDVGGLPDIPTAQDAYKKQIKANTKKKLMLGKISGAVSDMSQNMANRIAETNHRQIHTQQANNK